MYDPPEDGCRRRFPIRDWLCRRLNWLLFLDLNLLLLGFLRGFKWDLALVHGSCIACLPFLLHLFALFFIRFYCRKLLFSQAMFCLLRIFDPLQFLVHLFLVNKSFHLGRYPESLGGKQHLFSLGLLLLLALCTPLYDEFRLETAFGSGFGT